MAETRFWVNRDSGPGKGCWSLVAWGDDDWGWAIPLYVCIVFGAAFTGGYLNLAGKRLLGLFLVAAGLFLGLMFLGLGHCAEESSGWDIGWWSNWALILFVCLCAWFLRAPRAAALAPGGWASALVYRKVASPSAAAWARAELFAVGPVNELLTATIGEVAVWTALVAWLVIAFVERYDNLTDDPPTENSGYETFFGNKTRALGRAFVQMALRCLCLAVLSPSRNAAIPQLFGIPMDRAIKHHKRIGRLFYAFVCLHVVCMLAGGTEKGPVTWSKQFNLNEHNLWPGVVAFVAWTGQYVTSLPWFRRHHFEHFYFLHLNFMFVGNMFTIFHNRFRAVVWVIPAFAFFWLDFGIRWYTKMCKKASIVEYEIVDENLVKLVVRREGFPGAAFDFHPGSYIWLSVDVPADKRSEYMRDDIIGPPAFPVNVPSWVWFHPITVSSFDPETSHLTLFIKRFAGADLRGDGLDEWSGQLVHTMKAVRDAKMKLEDVRVHVGGPHGNLQVDPALCDHVVLCAGGIGVTPMAAILEDRVRGAKSGAIKSGSKTTLVWTTRSPAEVAAFSYLFAAIAELDEKTRCLFDVRIHLTGGAKADPETATRSANSVVTMATGRPDFDAVVAGCVAEGKANKVGVYVCGPEALSDAAEAAALRRGCLVHRETFEF